MGMELRSAPRRPANLTATITHPAGILLCAHIHNISSCGALVQTTVPLPPHLPVELVLRATDSNTLRLHRLRAIVTRAHNDTIGLRFKNIEPETLAALLKEAGCSFSTSHSHDEQYLTD